MYSGDMLQTNDPPKSKKKQKGKQIVVVPGLTADFIPVGGIPRETQQQKILTTSAAWNRKLLWPRSKEAFLTTR